VVGNALTAAQVSVAQNSPDPTHHAKQAKLSCEHTLRLVVAQVTGELVDTTVFIFKDRSDADGALRRLTDLALGSPRCPAAYGARGLVKQRLARTNWIPKDGPGQRVGVRWKEDALYDLGLAARAGGPAAVAAAPVSGGSSTRQSQNRDAVLSPYESRLRTHEGQSGSLAHSGAEG
jgi:hypothetical protein